MFKTRILILFVMVFMLAVALPTMAQDTTDDTADLETIEITISGTVEFIVADDGTTTVLVGGVVVSASETFNPMGLVPGSYVEITGVLMDDDSVMVITVNFAPEETPDPEETETPEPEETETPEPDVTEEAPIVLGNCVPETHPVANRIANAYDVDVAEVIAMHCAGNGFGNIARAFLLAEAAAEDANMDDSESVDGEDTELIITPEDAWAYLDLHGAGMGWGQIVQESGVHPSELAPGRLRNRNTDDTSDDGTELDTQSTSPGNSGNNGRGNGNNGRGNGNNGNNGRGNGNGRNG
ncbi:MAG: hypothetical protein CL607_10995 [Anaerolineaceae bacterium]|nr:hypothetical protein [Anaerolineaceae bacterium]